MPDSLSLRSSLKNSNQPTQLNRFSENLCEDPTLTLLLQVMSHLALKPEALAIASNLLKGSLRYMQGAALRPSLTLARHLGLLVLSTRVNQLHLIPPTSYGGVLRHLIPEPNRPSPCI